MFINAAADKLKREQDKRKADLAKRQAAERRAKVTADAHRREREDLARRERQEEAQRRAEERAELERVLTNNEGVRWERTFVGRRSDAAMVKGIRARCDDKVVLPPSAWRELTNAGAANVGSANGVFFEITVVNAAGGTRRTHAGALGFDGPEGEVGLPAPLMRRLGASSAYAAAPTDPRSRAEGAEESPAESPAEDPAPTDVALDVKLSFRRLPKGTWVKLQPRSADFQGELAADASVDLRELLEATLHRRCALTVGDDVSVPHGDREFSLRVVEVSPDDANGAVSLVETDVEVDIAPSEDYEDAMRRLAEAEERRLAAAAAVEQERREREGFAREEEEGGGGGCGGGGGGGGGGEGGEVPSRGVGEASGGARRGRRGRLRAVQVPAPRRSDGDASFRADGSVGGGVRLRDIGGWRGRGRGVSTGDPVAADGDGARRRSSDGACRGS
jgi:ubiquitin fusion degradation protein 1